LLVFGGALYKCRGDIAGWLNSRSAPADYSSRKIDLQRRAEDAQRIAERRAEDLRMALAKIEAKEKQAAEPKID